jgi:hypothetical protein
LANAKSYLKHFLWMIGFDSFNKIWLLFVIEKQSFKQVCTGLVWFSDFNWMGMMHM